MAANSSSKAFVYFLIALVVVVGAIIGLIAIVNNNNNPFKEISIETFENMQSDQVFKDKRMVFYIYDENCGGCRLISPKLKSVAKEQGVTVNTIRVDITSDDAAGFPEALQDLDITQTPTIFVMRNGVITGRLEGDQSSSDILEFFENRKVIE